jgi:hypothetical protein
MPFPTRPGGDLRQAVRERLSDRGGPLCGEQAWDFERAPVVFVVDAEYPESIRRRLPL